MTTQDFTNMLTTKIGLLTVAMFTSFQGFFTLLYSEPVRSSLGVLSLLVGIAVGIVTIWKTIRDERRKQIEHERRINSRSDSE